MPNTIKVMSRGSVYKKVNSYWDAVTCLLEIKAQVRGSRMQGTSLLNSYGEIVAYFIDRSKNEQGFLNGSSAKSKAKAYASSMAMHEKNLKKIKK